MTNRIRERIRRARKGARRRTPAGQGASEPLDYMLAFIDADGHILATGERLRLSEADAALARAGLARPVILPPGHAANPGRL